MKLCRAFIILLVLLCGFCGQAQADSCSASAADVAFGSVSPISGAAVGATGQVTVSCTRTTGKTKVLVCLSLGDGSVTSSSNPRSMANNSNNQMTYNLYADSGYSTIWGAAGGNVPTPISFTLPMPSLNTSVNKVITFYGKIAASQNTVPTLNNSTTTYTELFNSNDTDLTYQFYKNAAPTCSTASSGNTPFPFKVTADVINNCTVSAAPMNFGSQTGALNVAVDASSTLTVTCTNGDAYQVAMNGGSTSGNVTGRQMQNTTTGGTVAYQLYTDAARTIPWGDGTSGTSMVTGTGTGGGQSLTIYGRVPAQATPAPDTSPYTDTITVTISF